MSCDSKFDMIGGNLFYLSSTGTGRTGTFIAAYLIIERLKSDQMVDVFQTVRRIRESRPQFVETWVRT